MFLSLTWAIIADIDINSEVLRWMGDIRLRLWGVYRLLFVRTYAGSLELQGQDIRNKDQQVVAGESRQARHDEGFKYLCVLNIPWVSGVDNFGPLSKVNDGQNDVITQPMTVSRT